MNNITVTFKGNQYLVNMDKAINTGAAEMQKIKLGSSFYQPWNNKTYTIVCTDLSTNRITLIAKDDFTPWTPTSVPVENLYNITLAEFKKLTDDPDFVQVENT